MSLIRFYNPISTLEKVANSIFGNSNSNNDKDTFNEKLLLRPRVDIIENENSYQFNVEMPGFSKDQVKITCDSENILTINARKSVENETKTENHIRIERSNGVYLRRFVLPKDANKDDMNATMENGLLTLKVSKFEKEKPKEIEIQ